MKRHHIKTGIKSDFSSDTLNKEYPVSRDGLGFDISDKFNITSHINNKFANFDIVSYPNWVKAISKGTINNLVQQINIEIYRNRNSDDKLNGQIVLKQNKTNTELLINISQLGRLTEGTPTEYPYVNKKSDTVLGDTYDIVQLGEQIWLQSNLDGGAEINQNSIELWHDLNPSLYKPTLSEMKQTLVSGWSKVNKNTIQSYLESEGYSIFKHNIPTEDDLKEMLAFVLAKSGATGWDNYIKGSTGTTLAKKVLDTNTNGYDDVRVKYPDTWINAVNSGTLTDDLVKTGTDNFGMGILTAGIFHVFNSGGGADNPILGMYQLHTRGSDPDAPNDIVVYSYSHNSNYKNKGWFRRLESSAYLARPIRTLRYRELPYDIYDNGSQLIKVNKGDAIPSGYSVVPKGAKRGYFLGNPELPYNIITDMVGWLEAYLGNLNSQIG